MLGHWLKISLMAVTLSFFTLQNCKKEPKKELSFTAENIDLASSDK